MVKFRRHEISIGHISSIFHCRIKMFYFLTTVLHMYLMFINEKGEFYLLTMKFEEKNTEIAAFGISLLVSDMFMRDRKMQFEGGPRHDGSRPTCI